jgi:hypothetical protein
MSDGEQAPAAAATSTAIRGRVFRLSRLGVMD